MDIGEIVSTVQAEPLDEIYEIKPFTQESLEKYKVLVNEEITQQTREDFFAGV